MSIDITNRFALLNIEEENNQPQQPQQQKKTQKKIKNPLLINQPQLRVALRNRNNSAKRISNNNILKNIRLYLLRIIRKVMKDFRRFSMERERERMVMRAVMERGNRGRN